jgi:predicted peptidase
MTFRKTTQAMGLVATGTDFTILAMGMALWLYALGSGVGNAAFARGTDLFQAIGRCSYEIYLTHMFVVYAFFVAFQALFGPDVPMQAIYPASYTLVLAASVLLGYAVSRWFSEPANQALRTRLAGRSRRNRLVSVQTGSTLGAAGIVILAMLLTARPARAQDVVDGFVAQSFETRACTRLPYRLFVPDAANSGQPLAMVVYLHGAGGSGVDNLKQITGGNTAGTHLWTVPSVQTRYPTFVIAPQIPAGAAWNPADSALSPHGLEILDLVADLAGRYAIDRDRIYLVGQSLGGMGVWDLVAKRPDFFAAAVPVAGQGNPVRIIQARNVAIWAFHGARDKTIPAARSREMVDALKNAGGLVKYTEYPEEGHVVWERVFSDPRLPEWMFSQRRGKVLK